MLLSTVHARVVVEVPVLACRDLRDQPWRRRVKVAELGRQSLGRVLRDRHAGGVHQRERAHADAEGCTRHGVDGRDAAETLGIDAHRLVEPGHEEAVDREAGRIRGTDRRLAESGVEGFDFGQQRGVGAFARDQLDQLVLGGVIEVVRAEHAAGMRETGSDIADPERGGVGRQHAIRAHDAFQLREQRALDVEILEHRLDHQVDTGKVGQVGGRMQPRQRRRAAVGIEQAARHRLVQRGRDQALATRQPGLVGIGQVHLQALHQEMLRDRRAHGAGADHGNVAEAAHQTFSAQRSTLSTKWIVGAATPCLRASRASSPQWNSFSVTLPFSTSTRIEGRCSPPWSR